MGYSEFEELDPTVQLTIVDGIIGQISAGMYLRNRFSQGVTHTNLGLSDSEYKEMPPEEIDFLVEDWVMGQEVEASFTFDPIFREKENLLERLGTLIRKTQTQLLYLGSTEQVQLQSQPVRISERSISLGAIATIDTEDYKNVCVEVWLTNFDVPWLNTTSLLLNIAELLALARLKWLLESGPMR
ncbi:MAG: hypothetical protein RMK51_10800 [Meiothermus sp.]|uniref:hypothetical protein n=1 Tax=Meiothermus sp. TaxID=1955249 RepID=UPI00298EE0D6|nr:hypothetical protein [Meiothermus sp.]MDW8426415.1 hypothetical protein [Meiothermus sp.]